MKRMSLVATLYDYLQFSGLLSGMTLSTLFTACFLRIEELHMLSMWMQVIKPPLNLGEQVELWLVSHV